MNVHHVCYNDYAIHPHHTLPLHLRCTHVFWYISLLSLILISFSFIDGDTLNHTKITVGKCEGVKSGETVMMELDLRGEGRERTLHFFISGRQQQIYFYKLPSTVEFCVCNIVSFSCLLFLSHFILIHSLSSSLLFFS